MPSLVESRVRAQGLEARHTWTWQIIVIPPKAR